MPILRSVMVLWSVASVGACTGNVDGSGRNTADGGATGGGPGGGAGAGAVAGNAGVGGGGVGGSSGSAGTGGAAGSSSCDTSGGDPIPQYLTFDGGSGPTRSAWSSRLHLPWKNANTGDWSDANQEPQGAAAYATLNVAGTGPAQADVTELVARWLTNGQNRGFYLRSRQDWAFTFAGRQASDPAVRPTLTITTDSGTFTAPCIANAHWSPSTSSTFDTRAEFQVAKTSYFAIVQFDLSEVVGNLKSATLTLTCNGLKYPDAVDVFEADPPKYRAGGGCAEPTLGIAQSYVYDKGIEQHPSVLFASDFSEVGKPTWQAGGITSGGTQVADPATDSTYVRAVIPKGELYGCGLERDVTGGNPDGTIANTETELYARYYVYLEDDWGSNVDANKMPGWDGRFGAWKSTGYWYPLSGNGGGKASGLKLFDQKSGQWIYHGSSMRGHGGTITNDGNPYDSLFWIGGYIYHLDQPSDYGETVKWSGTVLERGKWYSIEHYLKMNSIEGPFDTVGNGSAKSDGVYKAWVDGVQVYERADFRWRRHPEMGLQGFWLNWYHGGKEPSPKDMHFRMNHVVIARDYIGPYALP
jgi:hypothetical protein